MTTDSRHGPPLIGALLRMPWEIARKRLLTGLHERGFRDLGEAHVALLLYPGPDDLRPSELAAQRRMSRQAVNYLLGQLERLGYLERRADPGGGRSTRISLTARGRRVARAMRETMRELEAEWEHELGRERFSELRGLLADLNARVGAGPPAGPRAARSAPPG
jgi:DNA-binding MarR family transcriptional regulator